MLLPLRLAEARYVTDKLAAVSPRTAAFFHHAGDLANAVMQEFERQIAEKLRQSPKP
jgi:hypothetical protein